MAWSEKAIEVVAQGLFDRIIVGGDGYQAAREDVKDVWRGYARFATDAAAAVDGDALCSTALRGILDERARQQSVEGWTPEHDDEHADGEMAHAAGCYALANHPRLLWVGGNDFPLMWPWHKRWWKPKDRRRDLVRAAALIVAEIERLDRIEARLK